MGFVGGRMNGRTYNHLAVQRFIDKLYRALEQLYILEDKFEMIARAMLKYRNSE